jgi:ABC-2 type transport system permease protein
MSTNDLFIGLGMQIAWILLGLILVNIAWKFAIRRFSAVGG